MREPGVEVAEEVPQVRDHRGVHDLGVDARRVEEPGARVHVAALIGAPLRSVRAPVGPRDFGTSADDIFRFVRSTRPAPSVEDVEDHIAWLDREGLVTERDLAVLRAAGYRV